MSEVRILEFVPVVRNSLRGFAKVEFPSGLIFHDVAIHGRDGVWWASPASKLMIGRDAVPMRAADGKLQYIPIVTFKTRERRDLWSNAIIEALRAQRPEAFRP